MNGAPSADRVVKHRMVAVKAQRILPSNFGKIQNVGLPQLETSYGTVSRSKHGVNYNFDLAWIPQRVK
jgi:hypothetical protein